MKYEVIKVVLCVGALMAGMAWHGVDGMLLVLLGAVAEIIRDAISNAHAAESGTK